MVLGAPTISPPNGLELPALDPVGQGAARHDGHNFYSMTTELAGKCAFPLRRKPRRH